MPVLSNSKLENFLEIEPDPMGPEVPSTEVLQVSSNPVGIFEKNDKVTPETIENSINNSIEYSLTAQADLINKAQELTQYAVEAANGGTARDIETASETINACSTAIEKLLDLQLKIQKLKGESGPDPSTVQYNQQNNIQVFSSTNEAIKLVKESLTK